MRRFNLLPLAVLLSGCAPSALDLAPSTPQTPPPGESRGFVLPPNTALAALPPPPVIDPARPYTLAGLIDIAESNDPRTRIVWDAARNAALAAGIAEATYLPQITATAAGAYQDSSGHVSAYGLGGKDEAHGAISAVTLNWLVFDFGERADTIAAAKQASAVSNFAFTATHQQLIYNVSLADYAYEAARAHAASAAQGLANAQAVQAAAQSRYGQGIGTAVEVAQATQATAQARLVLVQADGARQDAYLALLTAMGVSPLTQIRIADLPRRPLSPALAAQVQDIVAQALAQRPDMQSAYAAQAQSLANVRAAQAEFMPKVFVSATGAYTSGGLNVSAIPGLGQQAGTDNISASHLGGTILAGITVPLFDGGIRAAALDQARDNADAAAAALDQARDDAARQVVSAGNAVQTSLAADAAAQAAAAAAQVTFDAAFAAYRNGVGSVTDATMAQTQLLVAQDDATGAYSAALSAAATLAFTAGALGTAPAE